MIEKLEIPTQIVIKNLIKQNPDIFNNLKMGGHFKQPIDWNKGNRLVQTDFHDVMHLERYTLNTYIRSDNLNPVSYSHSMRVGLDDIELKYPEFNFSEVREFIARCELNIHLRPREEELFYFVFNEDTLTSVNWPVRLMNSSDDINFTIYDHRFNYFEHKELLSTLSKMIFLSRTDCGVSSIDFDSRLIIDYINDKSLKRRIEDFASNEESFLNVFKMSNI